MEKAKTKAKAKEVEAAPGNEEVVAGEADGGAEGLVEEDQLPATEHDDADEKVPEEKEDSDEKEEEEADEDAADE